MSGLTSLIRPVLPTILALSAVTAGGALASEPCGQDAQPCLETGAAAADVNWLELAMAQRPTPGAPSSKSDQRRSDGGSSRYDVRRQTEARGFRNEAFVRAGALFAGHESDGDFDPLGQSATLGYRRRIAQTGRGTWWVQPEFVYFRDTDRFDVVGVEVKRTFSGVGGLVSLGYGFDLGPVTPFATVGAGPLNIETEVDDTFLTQSVDELTVGYAATVGVRTPLVGSLSLEGAYRYLGSVRTDVFGLHSVEVGVSYSF